MVEEALRHLLAAGETEQAAAVVEQRIHALLDGDEWVTLERLLQRLPDDLIRSRPALLLAETWTSFIRDRWRDLPDRLAAATSLLDRAVLTAAPETVEALRGEADVFQAALQLDGAGRVAAARRALARLPAERRYVRGLAVLFLGLGLQEIGQRELAARELEEIVAAGDGRADGYQARALFGLAAIHIIAADMPAARRWATRHLMVSSEGGLSLGMAWANYGLGWVAYQWDELATAERHFAAVVHERRSVHGQVARDSIVGLALTLQAARRPAEAEALLAELDDFLHAVGDHVNVPTVEAVQARLALMGGDRAAVDRWLETADSGGQESLRLIVNPSLIRAQALLARGGAGDAAAAEALAGEVRARAEAAHATLRVIDAMALQALARAAADDDAAALDHLGRALALAEPGGLVRAFVDLGPPCADLLRRLGESRGESAYLRRLLAAFTDAPPAPPAVAAPSRMDRPPTAAPPPAAGAPALVEPLTRRELEVLACLAHQLTSIEIGTELAISPLTVKRHVQNICGKFGVITRRQAVRRAQSLGLLAELTPS
jgi:LuxR family maltose regulon positive regulatory protein